MGRGSARWETPTRPRLGEELQVQRSQSITEDGGGIGGPQRSGRGSAGAPRPAGSQAPPTHQQSPPPRVSPASSHGRPSGAHVPMVPFGSGCLEPLSGAISLAEHGLRESLRSLGLGACSFLGSAALTQPSRWPEHGDPAPMCSLSGRCCRADGQASLAEAGGEGPAQSRGSRK